MASVSITTIQASGVTEPDRPGVRGGSDDHAPPWSPQRRRRGDVPRSIRSPRKPSAAATRARSARDVINGCTTISDASRSAKRLEHYSCAVDGDRQQPQQPAQQRDQQAPAPSCGTASSYNTRLLGHKHVLHSYDRLASRARTTPRSSATTTSTPRLREPESVARSDLSMRARDRRPRPPSGQRAATGDTSPTRLLRAPSTRTSRQPCSHPRRHQTWSPVASGSR